MEEKKRKEVCVPHFGGDPTNQGALSKPMLLSLSSESLEVRGYEMHSFQAYAYRRCFF